MFVRSSMPIERKKGEREGKIELVYKKMHD